MSEFSDKKKRLSDFNEAGFQILRLHGLWLRANQCALTGSLNEWKWILDVIARELSPDIKHLDKTTKEGKTNKERLDKLNENISKAKGSAAEYKALEEKDIFLRCLQDDVGKGSKSSDHFEDIM